MKRLLPFLLLLLPLMGNAQQWPLQLTGNLQVHDPVMIKQGHVYYIFSTGNGITVKSSMDGALWSDISPVFGRPLAWWRNDIPEHEGHIWAPDIHYRNGRYHLYYSVSAWMNFNSSVGYATNTSLDPKDPAYKWVDHGMVVDFRNGGEGVNVIDPQVFVEEDGRVWLFYGSYKAGLRLEELDAEMGMLKDDGVAPVVITTSLGEGVFVVKADDYYYIFASRGICCKGLESNYQVVMGRSKTLQGPYLDKEGRSWVDNNYSLFMAGNDELPGRGHNGFYNHGDTTCIVYHAYTRSANGAPMLHIEPVYVGADGWPTLDKTDKIFSARWNFADTFSE